MPCPAHSFAPPPHPCQISRIPYLSLSRNLISKKTACTSLWNAVTLTAPAHSKDKLPWLPLNMPWVLLTLGTLTDKLTPLNYRDSSVQSPEGEE